MSSQPRYAWVADIPARTCLPARIHRDDDGIPYTYTLTNENNMPDSAWTMTYPDDFTGEVPTPATQVTPSEDELSAVAAELARRLNKIALIADAPFLSASGITNRERGI